MDELQIAWETAWSMSATMEAAGMQFIGKITRNNREYLFWRDLKGGYWYESKTEGREKPEWQQEAEHEARRRKYYGRAY